MRISKSAILLGLLLAAIIAPSLLAQGPENVLVVVNENSNDSQTLAEYYVRKRRIPRGNVCRITAPTEQSIPREAFNQTILEPVAACLRSRQLQDKILYIVTTRGLPLVVEGDPGPVGDMASVDSELSLLYAYLVYGSTPSYGKVENPFFRSNPHRSPIWK